MGIIETLQRVKGDVGAPPGTFRLIQEDDHSEISSQQILMLDPVPSSDPNEPLNWSMKRKLCNFALVMAVTCAVFTALAIQAIFWQLMVADLQVSYQQLNQTQSVNFVGLAMGCILFIPFARKFGRRPIYLVSTVLMLATSVWCSKVRSLTELYIINLLQGLAGATNETLVQVTNQLAYSLKSTFQLTATMELMTQIADIFFVHHRGKANGLYMAMVMCGSFLTPLAAGTQAQNQGWRACYLGLGVTNALLLILLVLFYEETKYTPIYQGFTAHERPPGKLEQIDALNLKRSQSSTLEPSVTTPQPSASHHELNQSIPLRTWCQGLALASPTDECIWPYFIHPFVVLFTFPAVMFSSLQYASGVVWLTVMATVLALVFPLPPYEFSPAQVAYMSMGPFIGNLIGAFYGGYLGDRSILYYSRKNNGFFEPEMRLHTLHLPALSMCGGLIMFGVTIAKGMHWILPCVAGALFGFGLGSIGDASLTFVIDSYTEVTGDAFTAVAFMRNAISIGIPFAINPWMKLGLTNMFVIAGFVSLAISLLFVPMIIYGKRLRRRTAPMYYAMSAKKGFLSTGPRACSR